MTCQRLLERLNVLSHLVALVPVLLLALARRRAATGEKSQAAEMFTDARRIVEEQLAASPENESLANFLADLILYQLESQVQWTVLESTEVTSEGGADLTKLQDGSILVSGALPEDDMYTLEANVPTDALAAVRLEALPHQSLVRGGPGRQPNFHLTEFELERFNPGSSERATSIPFNQASASFEQRNSGGWRGEVSGSIDGNLEDGRWAVGHRFGVAHEAFYRVATPVSLATEEQLRFRLHFRDPQWKSTSLGRFRLSITSDLAAFEINQRRIEILQVALPGFPAGVLAACDGCGSNLPDEMDVVSWERIAGVTG